MTQTQPSVQPTAVPTPAATDSAAQASPAADSAQKKTAAGHYATIKTTRGDIVLELYPDETPNTVQNFITKAQSKFYDRKIFHRVEDWVIQGGDPLGNGTGGGKMPTELSKRQFEVGSLGVARGGDIKMSNDSQFFICTDDCSWLTSQYTNFGKVVQGMDVAKSMQVGDIITTITIQ